MNRNIIIGVLFALLVLAVSLAAAPFFTTWAVVSAFVILVGIALYFLFTNRVATPAPVVTPAAAQPTVPAVVVIMRPYLWYILLPLLFVFGAYVIYALAFPEIRRANSNLLQYKLSDIAIGIDEETLNTKTASGVIRLVIKDSVLVDGNGVAKTITTPKGTFRAVVKSGRTVHPQSLTPYFVKTAFGKSVGLIPVMIDDGNDQLITGMVGYIPIANTRAIDAVSSSVSPSYIMDAEKSSPVTIPAPDAAPANSKTIIEMTLPDGTSDVNIDVIKSGKKTSEPKKLSQLCIDSNCYHADVVALNDSEIDVATNYDGGRSFFKGSANCDSNCYTGTWSQTSSVSRGKFQLCKNADDTFTGWYSTVGYKNNGQLKLS